MFFRELLAIQAEEILNSLEAYRNVERE